MKIVLLVIFISANMHGMENKESIIKSQEHHHKHITIDITDSPVEKEKKCPLSQNMKIALLTSFSSIISAVVSGLVVKYSNQC